MPPIEWYYARGDKQFGPVSPADLRQLAASGGLGPEDFVWREGMSDWSAARNVRGLFDGASPRAGEASITASPPPGTIPEMASASPPQPPAPSGPAVAGLPAQGARHVFDLLLEGIRAHFSAHFIEATTQLFIACGHYMLYVAMAATAVFSVSFAVRTGRAADILEGTIYVLVFAVLQYAARRSWESLDQLNRTTTAAMTSHALLDCFAVLNIMLGVAWLLTAAYDAIETRQYTGILLGLLLFVLCQYLAFIALSPATVNIKIVPTSNASEEAIGVLSFLLKAALRLAPIAFGVGVVYGTALLLYACYLLLADPGAMNTKLTGDDAFTAVTWFAALPVAAHLLFLVCYLLLDVVRAILSLPGKLEDPDNRERLK